MSIFRKEIKKVFDNRDQYIFDSELSDYADKVLIPNRDNLPTLYRYSSADYYNIRSLETRKIHLSEIGNMNDVFEGLTGEVDDYVIKNINKLTDLVYIKSFSEREDNLKMWGTYAKDYSGMCVAYEPKKLPKEVLCHLFPIIYTNERVTKSNLKFSFSELIEMKKAIENQDESGFDFLKDVMGLFLSKSTAWEDEKEWRLIFSYLQLNVYPDAVDAENEKILYDIPRKNIDNGIDIEFNCATKIFLGPKMEDIKKIHLYEIGEKLGIDVFDMQLSKDKYELEQKKVTVNDYLCPDTN